jgi:hypothetical protein
VWNLFPHDHDALVRLVERILTAKRLPIQGRQTGSAPDADRTALAREIEERGGRLSPTA